MNRYYRVPHLLWLALAALTAACVSPPAPRSLNETPLQLVAELDRDGRFAASPDGQQLAFGRQGLQLLDRASGTTRRLADAAPVALSWRRDGTQLAAGFAEADGEGRLAVFDRSGALLSEQPLPGRPVNVSWSSRHDLLVVGYRLQVYSFGANLSQWLVRVDDQGSDPVSLGDVTLRPTTAARLAPALPALLQAAFSADGDELVYLRLHDPPEFPAYLRLLYRNWQATGERKLLDLSLQPAVLAWEPSGEAIVLHPDSPTAQRIELWPQPGDVSATKAAPPPGAAAGEGGLRLQRLDDGRYLLATEGRLYSGAGLPERARSGHDDTLWQLRKWRFEGLITPAEFKETRP
jgi:hypothetical protein